MKAGKGLLLFIPKSIKGQMVIMLSVLACLQILVTAVIFNGIVGQYLEQSHREKTLGLAKIIAKMPIVIDALKEGETNPELQQKMVDMQKAVNAQFIVVARKDGIRLAHPVKERIGKQFVGGDYSPSVEQGKIYTSWAEGTLGYSLRGFAPVRDKTGEILGFVSVGYLETSVLKLVHNAQKEPLAYLFAMLFVGLVGANLIGGYVKKLTLGLEPSEIASMHTEREIILNSVRAAIIAVDIDGHIRFNNNEASRLLGAIETGTNIDEILPQAYVIQRAVDMQEARDEEIFVNGSIMMFNIIPTIINGKTTGAVATFRKKGEIDYLNYELKQALQCSELLRVQSHEYSNKLHTISGLLQLEEYDEAKNIILKESEGYHRLVEFTDKQINCSMVAGVILGKYNRAGELLCGFELDFNGGWLEAPSMPEHILTILGNLIDNGIDAATENKDRKPLISVGLYEDSENFYIQVEDTGKGLPEGLDIFQKGISTKSGSRGIGLYNVTMAKNALGATIETGISERLGGAYLSVKVPKKGAEA
ncbi:signal transduction histidine kinase regulating citrate/malate metabolism [Denitrovibrio acetiphilus DSM 12809]|uniref:Signal transduction histidine kinase regulating citrate/malate metabolism n=1 Tax=Denitrovibrio acetiphilus (strain DSM 12809 / NBRC 114555 / N2460) TaxID=522772 RepID=D4H813_DENA2|nr:sensor histidine kinase [Denitrovibrio acetiphilus]ADD68162.1 signal transduction histidine kinase regulating citrate/malate metabolism [Denitrovibrio acetiphilus DSM 12809]